MSQLVLVFSQPSSVWKNVSSSCLCVCSGTPGVDAHNPRLAFSAALTFPMDRAGTIIFDKVFVNEGGFYNSRTGEQR